MPRVPWLPWLLAASAAGAAAPLPPPGTPAWKPLTFRSIERHTRWQPIPGDVPGVRATADCAASALVLSVDDVDLAVTPRLAWRWRVVRALDVADERTKAGDDFAARVYVGFAWDPATASLGERLRHALGVRLYGPELWGAALVYVWTSHVAPGTSWPNPSTARARMIAVARGPADGWRDAVVDVRADHARWFPRARPDVTAVGVMTDADDTCGTAVADYGPLRWTGPAAP